MKPADHDNPHADVYAAEERRTRAMVEGDLSVLSALIDDDCRYVHSSGAVDTKATYLEKLQMGEVGYTWIRSSEQVVLDVGAGMAVSHLMEAQLVLSGVSRPYRSQAVALWRQTPLGLRLAYFQATALP